MVKQGVLAGRTAGLRPAQKRRLERLCHRRHPDDQVAELLCLQRLASESRELELPLTLVVDSRGLCRLLWVGPLEQSGRLLERLPGSERRQGSDLRLQVSDLGLHVVVLLGAESRATNGEGRDGEEADGLGETHV